MTTNTMADTTRRRLPTGGVHPPPRPGSRVPGVPGFRVRVPPPQRRPSASRDHGAAGLEPAAAFVFKGVLVS
ncbi:unnamed protein product [Merluccius merluccius]